MKKSGMLRQVVSAALLLGAAHGMAHADVVVGPAGLAISVMSSFPGSSSTLIDQSGLSATYVSGVTDFSTFTASTTHATQSFANSYLFSPTTAVGFDLGSVVDVNGVAVWNLVNNPASAKDVALYADTNSSLADGYGTLIGNYSLSKALGADSNLATTQSFGSVSSRYFVLELLNSYGGGPMVGLSEVAFSQMSAPVPEPETYALMLAGLGVMGALARRKCRGAV